MEILNYWNYWIIELGCWNDWIIELLKWMVELLNYWTQVQYIELLNPCSIYWNIELLNGIWHNELLKYWIEVVFCWNIELLNQVQYTEIVRIIECSFNILKTLEMHHSICHSMLKLLNCIIEYIELLKYWRIDLMNPGSIYWTCWNIEFNISNILNTS